VPITLPALICGAGPSGTRFGTPTRPTDSSRRFSKGSSWKLCLLGSGSLRLEFNFRSRRFANFAARVLCSVVTVTPHFTTHPPGRLIGKFSLEISVNIRDISLISTLCYHNLLGAATDFVHPPGQRVEVNKIVSDFVTRSLAVEFRCCRTRMTCNFPSYLAPQNVLGGRNGKCMPRLSPTLT